MKSGRSKTYAIAWWIATIIIAGALYYVALSDTIYAVTSPPGPLQILLRKSYSIAAFALVGWSLAQALAASGKRKPVLFIATAIAVYSALIEVGQALAQAHEGIVWNAVDVACGFIGGLIGPLLGRSETRR